ncbi:hypothetical protein K2X40_00800 [Candidatus Babeliales bacterium]|nr:hypothetical protein [Candidatus Babeliales bacterium]
MKKQPGFILIFSLIIISIMLVLTQQLVRGVYVGAHFSRTMVDRERAEMLVLGALNIALTKLTIGDEKEEAKKDEQASQVAEPEADKKETKEKKKAQTPKQKFLARVLPYLNRWQTINLTEENDGMAGQVKMCICCEHGKININEAYDFEKQEFKPVYQTLLKGLEIKGKLAAGEILQRLDEFLKKRRRKLDDISELGEIADFTQLDAFYKPPRLARAKGEKNTPNLDLALQDIFTLWTPAAEVELLFLSDALCAILGIRRPMADDAQTLAEKFKKVVSEFTENWGQNVDGNWQHLEPIYGDKPKFLSDVKDIFSKQFGPKVYSVLCYGKVGNVEQQLLAIVQEEEKKVEQKNSNDEKHADTKQQPEPDKKAPAQPQKSFRIVRSYWL